MCDKHVVKQPLECAQLLSTVAHVWSELSFKAAPRYNELIATKQIYRVTHFHHPCTKWLLESRHNCAWLVKHGIALCDEYYWRYGITRGRQHAARAVIECLTNEFPLYFKGDQTQHTPFVQCMPEELRSDDAVKSYRELYRRDKARFAQWTQPSKTPSWW